MQKVFYKVQKVSWQQIEHGTYLISEWVKKQKINFKGIWAPPRGGLIPGIMISHQTKLELLDRTEVKLFKDKDMLKSYKPLLIIDDIADTGKTLQYFSNVNNVYIATLFYHDQCSFKPDYWVFKKNNQWIEYPWERNKMKSESQHLKSLGSNKTQYSYDKPDPSLLESFSNQHGSNYRVYVNAPEFTSLCPKTGQPDFATIEVSYVPNKLCLESKSFKLYLGSFRNHGEFHEDCTNRIMNDLIELLKPKEIKVRGKFAPRGGISFTDEIEDFVYPYAKNRLISYYYESSIKKYINLYRKYNGDVLDITDYSLIIDSGAYSIWNSNKPAILPQNYANFCLNLLESILDLPFKKIEFINLDVIPGIKNQPLTNDQIKYAEEKSLENFIYLNNKIPNLLPVFHQGDNFKYIYEIEKYTLRYCVSPANDKSTSQRMLWIQDVFRYANANFEPHGLGFSNSTIAKANPWYSFDASTHALRAGFGVVMYQTETDLMDIVFSDVRTAQDTGVHFDHFSKIEKDKILEEFMCINEKFTYDNIMKSGKYRKMLNMYYISHFYKNLSPPLNLIQETLF